MPRTASTAVENNFINGWVTEATGLNFPENAVTDSNNIVFNYFGRIDRRQGIDLEEGYQTIEPDPVNPTSLFSEYLWETVAGDGNRTFFCQQIGAKVFVYKVESSTALSAQPVGSFDFTSYALVDLDTFTQHPFQYASGFGRLFISHPYMDPVAINYDPDTGLFGDIRIVIKIRDVSGYPGPYEGRSPDITQSHWYNLLNQGWDDPKKNHVRSAINVYPSDFDVWWLWKTPDDKGTPTFLNVAAVVAGVHLNFTRGNSPAPRGSVVLNAFYQDRTAATGVLGLEVTSSGPNRPAAIAFHAGRVWYGGVQAQEYTGKIYFTQIIEQIEQIDKCHQQNDPTAEFSSDFLPTDGGVIAIPEAGNILKMVSMEGSLLVFASNGIWQITGSQGIGFTATDYTVKKMSNQGTLSALSFVNVLGAPVWWGSDGIYSIVTDQVGGFQVKSLTSKKIEEYYLGLNPGVLLYAKGAFSQTEKVIYWLYRESLAANVFGNQTYTNILAYDIRIEAFYKLTIAQGYGIVKGITNVLGYGTNTIDDPVTDNADNQVTTNLLELVTVDRDVSLPVNHAFKFTTLFGGLPRDMTFAEFKNNTFRDWATLEGSTGVDTQGYLTTGYRVRGEAARKFQNNYITMVSDSTDPSSYLFYARWDYANSVSTKRWASPQQVTHDTGGYDYQSRRLKVRGTGKALQYRIETIPDKPISIVGWSAYDTTNASL